MFTYLFALMDLSSCYWGDCICYGQPIPFIPEMTALIDAHTSDDLFVESNASFAIDAPIGSFYCVSSFKVNKVAICVRFSGYHSSCLYHYKVCCFIVIFF